MKVKKELFTTNLIFGWIFLTCVLLAKYKIFSYVSIFFFAIHFVYYCILKNKEFALKYLAFLFISGVAVLGTAIIELFPSIYLVELRCYSSFVGSLPLIVFGYWLFLVVINLVDKNYEFEIIRERIDELAKYKKFYNTINLIVLILFLVLFSSVATHPAFLLGVDRFAYASQYSQFGMLKKIVSNAPLLVVFPILAIIYNKNFQRILGTLGVTIYILYFVWVGDKFGPFFSLICIFLLIFYKRILEKGRRFLKKILIISFGLFGGIVILAIVFSASISSYSSLTYFAQRGAQQGQLWWKTYEICKNIHPTEFGNEIKAVTNGKDTISANVGSNNGIYKIMYLCAPKEQVDSKLSTGSRYTEAGFATIYYYFGTMGVILFSCIMGGIVAATINAFIRALNNGDYVKALIFLRFFLLERSLVTMFIFNNFVGIISIASYLYLLLMKRKKILLNGNGGFGLVIIKY